MKYAQKRQFSAQSVNRLNGHRGRDGYEQLLQAARSERAQVLREYVGQVFAWLRDQRHATAQEPDRAVAGARKQCLAC